MACVTAACTPALNWRDVTVDRLKVQLPCKADRAQRPVNLHGATLMLDMAGCQAADALFAVSHTHIPDGASVSDVLAAWQIATLENMQVKNPADTIAAYRATSAAMSVTKAAVIANVAALQVTGVNPEGSAIEAQLTWFVAGRDVYHMAVYAPAIKPDMTEPLFTQAKLQ